MTANSSLDFENFVTPWNQRVSCAILFSSICIVGITSNGLAVGLSFFSSLRKNNVHLFIANLAVSDFMCTGVFLFGQNLYILYREDLPASGCSWLAFMNFIAAVQEFIFPPFLAVNRYIALYHTSAYDRIYTSKNMALMAIGSWAFSSAVPLIFTLMGHTGFDRKNEHCCVVVEENTVWTIIYWMIIIVPLVGVCDSTMVFCNWKIYKKLKEHVQNSGTILKKNVVTENKEILYFMIIDMAMPIFAHSVYHISKFAVPNRITLMSRQFFTCLYLGNAAIRGIIIVMMLRPYRNAFKRSILRLKPNSIGMASALAKTPDL